MTQPVYQRATNNGVLIIDKIGDRYVATTGSGGRVEHYSPMTASEITKRFDLPETVLQSGR